LYRLSFKIRNPATRLGFTKARYYRQVDQDTGINLIDQFTIFDHKHLEEVFAQLRHISCHDAKENFLVQRLAKANTRRRQQFRQWRKHRVKLETGHEPATGTSALNPSTLERPGKVQLLEMMSGPGLLVPSIPSTATRVDQSKIDLHDNSSIISSSTYALLKESPHALAIPQLPKNVLEKKEFECPYCCVICSQRTGKEAWDFKQWVAHETNCHRTTRQCPDHLPEKFSSLEAWREHLSVQHHNSSNTALFEAIEPITTRGVVNRSCPICLDANVTLNHIAVHLQKIALFALPRSTGSENDTGQNSAYSYRTYSESRMDQFDDLEELSFFDGDNVMDDRPLGPIHLLNTKESIPVYGLYRLASKIIRIRRINRIIELFTGLQISFERGLKLQYHLDSVTISTDEWVKQQQDQNEHDGMRDYTKEQQDQSKHYESVERLRRVLRISEEVHGTEHPKTLIALNDLGTALIMKGEYDEAIKVNRRVLDMRTKALGLEHPDTLSSMENLATMYATVMRWNEAEELAVQVMKISQKLLGTDHPNTMNSMAELAFIYQNQERLKEAGELAEQATEGFRKLLGTEHPNTINSMANLSSIYQDQGRLKEAGELAVQVWDTSQKVFGPDHRSALRNAVRLISIYRMSGQWVEAEKLGVSVMDRSKRVLGTKHKVTVWIITELALVYKGQGRLKEAEQLEMEAMQTSPKITGTEQPNVSHG
ncbi:MAG: hypothetical protein Q9187_004160, partial [Circinaria calcarea]